ERAPRGSRPLAARPTRGIRRRATTRRRRLHEAAGWGVRYRASPAPGRLPIQFLQVRRHAGYQRRADRTQANAQGALRGQSEWRSLRDALSPAARVRAMGCRRVSGCRRRVRASHLPADLPGPDRRGDRPRRRGSRGNLVEEDHIMRVGVIGGAGFIGSHVVDKLLEAGHDVTVFDIMRPHRTDVRHVVADILDASRTTVALAGRYDALYLLA